MPYACCLLTGEGISDDFEETMHYFELAADQGDAEALSALFAAYW